MAKQRFPNLLHVTREDDGEGDEYFVVHDDGVQSIDKSGEPVAIYKLIKVGVVSITKGFVEGKQSQ